MSDTIQLGNKLYKGAIIDKKAYDKALDIVTQVYEAGMSYGRIRGYKNFQEVVDNSNDPEYMKSTLHGAVTDIYDAFNHEQLLERLENRRQL